MAVHRYTETRRHITGSALVDFSLSGLFDTALMPLKSLGDLMEANHRINRKPIDFLRNNKTINAFEDKIVPGDLQRLADMGDSTAEGLRRKIMSTTVGNNKPQYNPDDPAYQMSMPSNDPADVLGYTQNYQSAIQHPISRMGWNPQYDVYPPKSLDTFNKGDKTNIYGYSLPAGESWSMYRHEPAGKMMEKTFAASDPVDAMRWSESDQTVYINSRVKETNRETPIHESVHRGIGKLYSQVFDEDIDTPQNELLTRIWDYRNSEYGKDSKKRPKLERYIRKQAAYLMGKEAKDVTLDEALATYEPKLDLMAEKAVELRKQNYAGDYDLVWFNKQPK